MTPFIVQEFNFGFLPKGQKFKLCKCAAVRNGCLVWWAQEHPEDSWRPWPSFLELIQHHTGQEAQSCAGTLGWVRWVTSEGHCDGQDPLMKDGLLLWAAYRPEATDWLHYLLSQCQHTQNTVNKASSEKTSGTIVNPVSSHGCSSMPPMLFPGT